MVTAGGSYGTGGAAAGWYPDPQNPAGQRYWDGTRWTVHTSPAIAGAPRKQALSVAARKKNAKVAAIIILIVAGLAVVVLVLVATVTGLLS